MLVSRRPTVDCLGVTLQSITGELAWPRHVLGWEFDDPRPFRGYFQLHTCTGSFTCDRYNSPSPATWDMRGGITSAQLSHCFSDGVSSYYDFKVLNHMAEYGSPFLTGTLGPTRMETTNIQTRQFQLCIALVYVCTPMPFWLPLKVSPLVGLELMHTGCNGLSA